MDDEPLPQELAAVVRQLARRGISFDDIVGMMRLTPETVRECLDSADTPEPQ